MDQEAEQLQLESEQKQIQEYLNHPISKRIREDHDEQASTLITIVLEHPVTDIESLVKHFEAIGHVRGLKRSTAITLGALEDIQERLKDIKS